MFCFFQPFFYKIIKTLVQSLTSIFAGNLIPYFDTEISVHEGGLQSTK